MHKLSLKNFIGPVEDTELKQYELLKILQDYAQHFHRNRLFPALDYLLLLNKELKIILNEKVFMNSSPPDHYLRSQVSTLDNLNEPGDLLRIELNKVWKLVEWGYEKIFEVLREGIIIHNFVKENLHIMLIEESTDYAKDGILLVPDNVTEILNIYRFEKNANPVVRSVHKSITTKPVGTIRFEEFEKGDLIEFKNKLEHRFPDYPYSSVYAVNTDLDFPFDETILPVAKELLAAEITARS